MKFLKFTVSLLLLSKVYQAKTEELSAEYHHMKQMWTVQIINCMWNDFYAEIMFPTFFKITEF